MEHRTHVRADQNQHRTTPRLDSLSPPVTSSPPCELLLDYRSHVRSLRARTVSLGLPWLHHICPIPAPRLIRHFVNRQNNESLAALSGKITALRDVTLDIYDNSRDHAVLDSTTDTFSNMTTSIKGSARRLGVMASRGDKIAVFKLAGILIAIVLLLYWIGRWIL